MARAFSSSRGGRQVAVQLLEALGSSLDIRVVLKAAYPLLTRLVPADYGALGVSPSGQPEDFQWSVAELPEAFFAAYPEMAAHDFVRSSVAREPNVVLRDQEMVSRRELEQNPMYRRAREVGAPLEQVMAVMLHIDDRWQSGLSLYRDRRRPFSRKERALLQQVTPALANAVRNCHLFGIAADWQGALDSLIESPAISILLVAHDGREVARSAGVTRLLDRWFTPHERRGGRLPAPLADFCEAALAGAGPITWRKPASDMTLEVTCIKLTGHSGRARWMLRFEERADSLSVPRSWRLLLTSREQQVTDAVLRGWDNRLIAAELGCAEATVKKHLQGIFAKLGLASRAALIARAALRE
jgi:DNA-binding CsgD family transcriptional regulator